MVSLVGFVYWIINARLYSPEEIGLAVTLISATSLVTNFSLVGLNNSIVKYLPKSKDPNNVINTILLAIVISSFIAAVIFLLGLNVFFPKILFIRENFFYALLFCIFIIFSALNAITDSIFINGRTTQYILIINTIMSVFKLLLVFALVKLGSYGIFYSFAGSIILAMLLSIFFIIRKFKYRFSFFLDIKLLRTMAAFSFANYVASFISMAPGLVIPLIITNNLDPKVTAYYYLPSMIINILLAIPRSATSSLFAESSHDDTKLVEHVGKTLKSIYTLLIPAVLIIVLFGRYILLVFGKSFSDEGYVFLNLTSISLLFGSLTFVANTVFIVKSKLKYLMFSAVTTSLLSIGLTYGFIGYGLLGIGYSGLASQMLAALIVAGLALRLMSNGFTKRSNHHP